MTDKKKVENILKNAVTAGAVCGGAGAAAAGNMVMAAELEEEDEAVRQEAVSEELTDQQESTSEAADVFYTPGSMTISSEMAEPNVTGTDITGESDKAEVDESWFDDEELNGYKPGENGGMASAQPGARLRNDIAAEKLMQGIYGISSVAENGVLRDLYCREVSSDEAFERTEDNTLVIKNGYFARKNTGETGFRYYQYVTDNVNEVKDTDNTDGFTCDIFGDTGSENITLSVKNDEDVQTVLASEESARAAAAKTKGAGLGFLRFFKH